MEEDKFEKGEILVCVIWVNSYLEKFKEYECKGISNEEVMVDDEYGDTNWYNKNRFRSKAKIREYKLNEIID